MNEEDNGMSGSDIDSEDAPNTPVQSPQGPGGAAEGWARPNETFSIGDTDTLAYDTSLDDDKADMAGIPSTELMLASEPISREVNLLNMQVSSHNNK